MKVVRGSPFRYLHSRWLRSAVAAIGCLLILPSSVAASTVRRGREVIVFVRGTSVREVNWREGFPVDRIVKVECVR
jgi:hypothetical protein